MGLLSSVAEDKWTAEVFVDQIISLDSRMQADC
jgi:hypothetical protein